VLWVGVTILALFAFQAKNLPYIVLLLPALCVFGVLDGPRFLDRWPAATLAALAILCAAKVFATGEPWSLRPASPALEGAKAMRAYYNFHRDAELIAVDPDDEFYSATLPLLHVRYVFLDPSGAVQRSVPYYAPLGITLTAAQFIALPVFLPQFIDRLHDWGLNSAEPVGSAVTVRQPSDLVAIVRARPGSDFYVPSDWGIRLDEIATTHEPVQYSASRVFLLSRSARLRQQAPELPPHW
jgi:hypothetical protein